MRTPGSGSTHVITIDIGEAVGELREVLRRQIASVGEHLGKGQVSLMISRNGGAPEPLTPIELTIALESIAKNIVQTLYALEVEG